MSVVRTPIQVMVPVRCPLCTLDAALLAIDTETGVDLPPVLVDLGLGRDVVVHEHVTPWMVAVVLTCGCTVSTPPWVLVFEVPGVPPYFRLKDPT